jgi:hypothetical protein
MSARSQDLGANDPLAFTCRQDVVYVPGRYFELVGQGVLVGLLLWSHLLLLKSLPVIRFKHMA